MISVLVPSRGRPDGLQRLHESLAETTVGEWEIVVRLDDDDPDRDAYPDLPDVHYLTGPREVLSVYWNQCYDHAKGDTVMQCGDDIVFRSIGWDQIVDEAFPEDDIAFVHGDDLSPNGKLFGTHGFVRRAWVETVGYLVPPLFVSDYNDTWLNAVATVLDRRAFRAVTTEHLHPGLGKGEWDRTHLERIARHEASDPDGLYSSVECAAMRVRDAAKLLKVMR